jgi:hypothetical protein
MESYSLAGRYFYSVMLVVLDFNGGGLSKMDFKCACEKTCLLLSFDYCRVQSTCIRNSGNY